MDEIYVKNYSLEIVLLKFCFIFKINFICTDICLRILCQFLQNYLDRNFKFIINFIQFSVRRYKYI